MKSRKYSSWTFHGNTGEGAVVFRSSAVNMNRIARHFDLDTHDSWLSSGVNSVKVWSRLPLGPGHLAIETNVESNLAKSLRPHALLLQKYTPVASVRMRAMHALVHDCQMVAARGDKGTTKTMYCLSILLAPYRSTIKSYMRRRNSTDSNPSILLHFIRLRNLTVHFFK